MGERTRVLIAGESWVTHSIHQKGFDAFTTTSYHEGVGPLRDALEAGGFQVDYQPSHIAARDFPATAAALADHAAIVVSDIGANTLLLHPDTFERSQPLPDRTLAIRDYVMAGGGLVMVGGYLTFAGIDGRARWGGTPVAEVLPVRIAPTDDRMEVPAGAQPQLRDRGHAIVAGLPEPWPALLGYNRVELREGATLVATVGDDPLIAAGSFGRGRAAVFTSDCGPHWCPPPFVGWPGYARLWQQLVGWVADR